MTEIRDIEPIDRIPGDPLATCWRQAARRHQHQWREANGWPVGEHVGPQGVRRAVGSRLGVEHAQETACNFLTPSAADAVRDRLQKPQKHQTLDSKRLWSDLLSSMPMCFNLFGPLWADEELAAAVAQRWFPDLVSPGDRVTVGFEWSPGRRDTRWLGDRTAFDAVLHITGAAGSSLIGIETKYHEYPGSTRHGDPIPKRYREVTNAASMFADDWESHVWGTRVEQVWRDHLLALACKQADDGLTRTRYVLTAPAANRVWEDLASEYRGLLRPEARPTFDYRTIDSLLADAEDLLPHRTVFAQRYLEVDLDPQ